MNSRTGIVMPDPALQTDAFRGRSAEPPRRKLLRGLITPFFRRSRRIALRILERFLMKSGEVGTLSDLSHMLTTGLATKTPVGQRRLKTPQETRFEEPRLRRS